jgi:hypothetical protein
MHRDARTLSVRVRLFRAAERVRADLPPDVAARLATAPAELMPPVHYARTLDVEISDKTPCDRGPDARGRFVARARPARRRAAERDQARAEADALAPWRVGIARARLAKRAALEVRRAVRSAKREQDLMQRRAVAVVAGLGAGVPARKLPPGGRRNSQFSDRTL